MTQIHTIATFMIILSFTLHSVIPAFAEESTEGWERLSDMPEVRSEMESVVIEEKIYAIGGLNNLEQATSTVFILDTKDDSWHTGTPMSVSLHHAGAATYENKIYVVGGYLDGWIPTDSLLIYDLETDAWSKGQDMPTPRGALTAQFVGGKLYAIGGYNESSLDKNEVYDPATNSWESKSSLPTPREHLTSAVLDDNLYTIGGRTGQNNLHAAEMYDYQSDTWTVLEPLPTLSGSS